MLSFMSFILLTHVCNVNYSMTKYATALPRQSAAKPKRNLQNEQARRSVQKNFLSVHTNVLYLFHELTVSSSHNLKQQAVLFEVDLYPKTILDLLP